jgi:hypothetical protein
MLPQTIEARSGDRRRSSAVWDAVRTVVAATFVFGGSAVTAQEPPTPPKLEFAFEVRAEVAAPTVVGTLPTGTRRIIDILGGSFEGPSVKGKLLPGGADWQLIRDDGFTEIDARYTLETAAGSSKCRTCQRSGYLPPTRARSGPMRREPQRNGWS